MSKSKKVQMQKWVGQVKTSPHDIPDNQVRFLEDTWHQLVPLAVRGYASKGRGVIFFPNGCTPGAAKVINAQLAPGQTPNQETDFIAQYLTVEGFRALIDYLKDLTVDPEYWPPQSAINTVEKRVSEYDPQTHVVVVVYRTDGGFNSYVRELD